MTALLPGGLDDFALVVRGVNIKGLANGIQGDHGNYGPVRGEPCVFAGTRKTGHQGHGAAMFDVRRVVQAAELMAVEKESRLFIGESVGT